MSEEKYKIKEFSLFILFLLLVLYFFYILFYVLREMSESERNLD